MKLSLRLFLLFLSLSLSALAQEEFSKVSGLDEDLHSLALSPFESNVIFAGSRGAIFKSLNSGKDFKKVFSIKGDLKRVNHILFDPYLPEKVFAATDSGLYVTSDLGRSFTKIFKTQNDQGSYIKCLSLARHKGRLYLGTSQGFYSAEEDLYVFRRLTGIPQQAAVFDIKIDFKNKDVLLASSQGLYKAKLDSNDFQRLFISRPGQEPGEPVPLRNIPLTIYLEPKTPSIVYLGTSSGLFRSGDHGKSWKKIDLSGLEGLRINRIAGVDAASDLYLATDKGFYEASQEKGALTNLYKGLLSRDIRDFKRTSRNIFLATSKGLYRVAGESFKDRAEAKGQDQSPKQEPSYNEICEVALRYNDLHPDKTKLWRKSLYFRALFPVVKLDYDKTINYDSGVDKYYTGPKDWGVSLAWDIGDLVWNTYHDDIDTRNRLNVQTRIDILDDLRRIYFERRKLKLKLAGKPPVDSDSLEEKQLYLEELTAALDSYTGGYFSARSRQLEQKP